MSFIVLLIFINLINELASLILCSLLFYNLAPVIPVQQDRLFCAYHGNDDVIWYHELKCYKTPHCHPQTMLPCIERSQLIFPLPGVQYRPGFRGPFQLPGALTCCCCSQTALQLCGALQCPLMLSSLSSLSSFSFTLLGRLRSPKIVEVIWIIYCYYMCIDLTLVSVVLLF